MTQVGLPQKGTAHLSVPHAIRRSDDARAAAHANAGVRKSVGIGRWALCAPF